jgi:hypothetical protein
MEILSQYARNDMIFNDKKPLLKQWEKEKAELMIRRLTHEGAKLGVCPPAGMAGR